MKNHHFTKFAPFAVALMLLGAGCSPKSAEMPVSPAPMPEVSADIEAAPSEQPVAAPTPTSIKPVTTVPPGTTSRTLTFKPQGDAKVTGSATFTKVKEGLRVAITLKNTDLGKSHSANIESGTCAQRGELRYALANVIKGTSVTILNDLGFEHIFQKDKVMSIKIKPSNESLYVACADIR